MLQPGDSIRLKVAHPRGRLKGTIQSLDESGVTIVDKGGENLSLPWASIKRLDVQVGLHRRYALWAISMAGLGAALGLAVPEHETCYLGRCEEGTDPRQMAVILAVAGGVTGLIVTRASPPTAPKWERVKLPYRPACDMTPGRGTSAGEESPP